MSGNRTNTHHISRGFHYYANYTYYAKYIQVNTEPIPILKDCVSPPLKSLIPKVHRFGYTVVLIKHSQTRLMNELPDIQRLGLMSFRCE